jgi:hypothetical protein
VRRLARQDAALVGLLVIATVGCAARSIDQMSNDELCVLYHVRVDDPGAALHELHEPDAARAYNPRLHKAAAEEIRKRALISADSWPDADSGQVRVGMSRCAVLAAMGVPSKSNPADDKWIYHREGRNSLYVSFRAGRVDNAWVN